MSLPYVTKGFHNRKVNANSLYIYGANPEKVGKYTWGFPGSSYPLIWRYKGPEHYIPVYSEDVSPGPPKVFNTEVRTQTRKSTGEVTQSTKVVPVLRTNFAAESSHTRANGVFKLFKIPGIQVPEFNWLMPTVYKRSEISIKVHPGTALFAGESSVYSFHESVVGYAQSADIRMIPNLTKVWNNSGTADYNLRMLARSRAIAKVRQNEIELSVTLAESKKTISHLAQTAKQLFDVYRAMKRGDFKTVWRLIGTPDLRDNKKSMRKKFYSLKDPAGRWLEFQYAWRPLLNDVNGAIALALTEKRANVSFRVTGSATSDWTHSVSAKPGDRDWFTHNAAGKKVCKTVLHYAVTDPALVFLGQSGVNPLLAIWEIVPWSFVVDWFLGIGDALEAMDVSIGKEFISGTDTWFNSGVCHSAIPIMPGSNMPFGWTRLNTGTSLCETTFMVTSRNPLTTWPTVSPRFKNPISTTHVLNAIALARSLRKR